MTFSTITVEKKDYVLHIQLNRPDVRNAFNATLINELTQAFTSNAMEAGIRLVVLSGAGSVFSAGGDLNWMKEAANYTRDQNIHDAQYLSKLLDTINTLPIPVIAKVQGSAMGGGVGLVSVADYVITEAAAKFAFSETKLGLIPACIGPFVVAKIGYSQARALFLSAELFSAERALQMGLVHRVAPSAESLETETDNLVKSMLANSPQALKTAKTFLRQIEPLSGQQLHGLAAQTLADLRASPEGQEGIKAFLEKRKPGWQ